MKKVHSFIIRLCKSISQKKEIQISHFDVISLISNARKIFCSKKKTYWTQLGIEPKLNPNSIEQKILTIKLPDISLLKTRVSVCLVYSTISELKQNFGLLFVWLEKKIRMLLPNLINSLHIFAFAHILCRIALLA